MWLGVPRSPAPRLCFSRHRCIFIEFCTQRIDFVSWRRRWKNGQEFADKSRMDADSQAPTGAHAPPDAHAPAVAHGPPDIPAPADTADTHAPAVAYAARGIEVSTGPAAHPQAALVRRAAHVPSSAAVPQDIQTSRSLQRCASKARAAAVRAATAHAASGCATGTVVRGPSCATGWDALRGAPEAAERASTGARRGRSLHRSHRCRVWRLT